MSGGVLTDYRHNLYLLKEWAGRIESQNPLLAEQLCDLYELLGKYDYFLSADIGEERIQEAWAEYRDKWLGIGSDRLREMVIAEAKARVDDYIQSVERGYIPDRGDDE